MANTKDAKKATAKGTKKVTAKATKRLKVTLLRSPIGFNEKQGRVVESLGLRRIRHTVEIMDTPETRGMLHKVRHLVEVLE